MILNAATNFCRDKNYNCFWFVKCFIIIIYTYMKNANCEVEKLAGVDIKLD